MFNKLKKKFKEKFMSKEYNLDIEKKKMEEWSLESQKKFVEWELEHKCLIIPYIQKLQNDKNFPTEIIKQARLLFKPMADSEAESLRAQLEEKTNDSEKV